MKRKSIIGRVAAGIAVAAVAVMLFLPREYRALVSTYQLTNDPRQIVLHASLGRGDSVIGSEVREEARTVTVIVKARDAGGRTAGGEGVSHFVTVTLRDPIGERTVIDGTDLVGLAGHVVPRVP